MNIFYLILILNFILYLGQWFAAFSTSDEVISTTRTRDSEVISTAGENK